MTQPAGPPEVRNHVRAQKALTMRHYWVPSINHHGGYGRWAVAEFTDAYAIEADFAATIEAEVAKVIDLAIESATALEGVASR